VAEDLLVGAPSDESAAAAGGARGARPAGIRL